MTQMWRINVEFKNGKCKKGLITFPDILRFLVFMISSIDNTLTVKKFEIGEYYGDVVEEATEESMKEYDFDAELKKVENIQDELLKTIKYSEAIK